MFVIVTVIAVDDVVVPADLTMVNMFDDAEKDSKPSHPEVHEAAVVPPVFIVHDPRFVGSVKTSFPSESQAFAFVNVTTIDPEAFGTRLAGSTLAFVKVPGPVGGGVG